MKLPDDFECDTGLDVLSIDIHICCIDFEWKANSTKSCKIERFHCNADYIKTRNVLIMYNNNNHSIEVSQFTLKHIQHSIDIFNLSG